jgi:hypothetical protein
MISQQSQAILVLLRLAAILALTASSARSL